MDRGIALAVALFCTWNCEVTGQYIGVVRCYVCTGNQWNGVKDFASCPDIYDPKTTTIRYCEACLKYRGYAISNYTNLEEKAVVRGCFNRVAFDDSIEGNYSNGGYEFAPNQTGIFQQSGLHERPSTGHYFAIRKGMSIWGNVTGVNLGNAKRVVSYGPGDLYVCNDGDLCNDGSRSRPPEVFKFLQILAALLIAYIIY